jgi:hypothetical protein
VGCRCGRPAGGIWSRACRDLSGSGRSARPPLGAHAEGVEAGTGPVEFTVAAERIQQLVVELPHAVGWPVDCPSGAPTGRSAQCLTDCSAGLAGCRIECLFDSMAATYQAHTQTQHPTKIGDHFPLRAASCSTNGVVRSLTLLQRSPTGPPARCVPRHQIGRHSCGIVGTPGDISPEGRDLPVHRVREPPCPPVRNRSAASSTATVSRPSRTSQGWVVAPAATMAAS